MYDYINLGKTINKYTKSDQIKPNQRQSEC